MKRYIPLLLLLQVLCAIFIPISQTYYQNQIDKLENEIDEWVILYEDKWRNYEEYLTIITIEKEIGTTIDMFRVINTEHPSNFTTKLIEVYYQKRDNYTRNAFKKLIISSELPKQYEENNFTYLYNVDYNTLQLLLPVQIKYLDNSLKEVYQKKSTLENEVQKLTSLQSSCIYYLSAIQILLFGLKSSCEFNKEKTN